MATTSAESSSSSSSYIGSSLRITTKSAIRYEGVIFHLNASPATVGLQNVRCIGTEGRRRKDGGVAEEVPPSDTVYDHIYFRGSDIKELEVLSSPTVQTASALHDDPAIIQFHYVPPAPPSGSASLPPVAIGSETSFSSNAQLGLPASTFQDSLHQYQLSGNVGSRSSSLPLQMNRNEHATLMYCLGFNGTSVGVPILHQQALLQPVPGLVVSPSGQQQMQVFITNASLSVPTSTLPISASYQSSNQTENSEPTLLPVTSTSHLPSMSSLTCSHLDPNAIVRQTIDKPKIVLGSTSPHQSEPTSTPSIGKSYSDHTEASALSLVAPCQFLQFGSIEHFPSTSLQATQKDMEVVQVPTSESLSTDSKNASATNLPLKSVYVVKSQRAGTDNELGKRNESSKDSSYSQHHERRHERGKRNGLKADPLYVHRVGWGHSKGREHKLYGITSRTHLRNKGQEWRVKNETSHAVTNFMEDFDFAAMNEKFKKDEIWGQLGKSNKCKTKGKGGDNDNDNDNDEDSNGLTKVETKPVFGKDNFFDSASCNSLNHDPRKGMVKFSEQMKLDKETFGDIELNPGGRGYPGGRAQGSQYGRGYCHAGWGRGR